MIEIKEVKTPKELKKFVKFPYELYKDNPFYIPVLINDEMTEFNPEKNDAFTYCKSRQFIAYQNGKIVGRIATVLNNRYNEVHNLKQLRFTRFDTINDIDVSKALFDKVKEVAKENNCNEIIGPIGFCDLDKQGMLCEGYNRLGLYITPYNYAYYNEHMSILGFTKDVDWVEYLIEIPNKVDEKLEKISHYVINKFGFTVKKFTKVDEVLDFIEDGMKLMNDVYSHLYGYVELTDKQIIDFVQNFKSIIDPRLVVAILDKESKLIGYGLAAPSVGKAFQKSKGHLTPFTILRLIKAMSKNDTIDLYSVGVRHEYQNQGLNSIILSEIIKSCNELGYKYAETGPELETNSQVQAQWKDFKREQHKRRRSYKIKVE